MDRVKSTRMNDGAGTNWAVGTLPHDIGDIHAPCNHDDRAAAIQRRFLLEKVGRVVRTHGDFRMIYHGHHVGGDSLHKTLAGTTTAACL